MVPVAPFIFGAIAVVARRFHSLLGGASSSTSGRITGYSSVERFKVRVADDSPNGTLTACQLFGRLVMLAVHSSLPVDHELALHELFRVGAVVDLD